MLISRTCAWSIQIFLPPKKCKVKLDKVREGLRPITLRFRANARKLILGSIGTPFDHLSVNILNPWVWCHVQVCVQLYDALICISMPAWLYFFHLSFILGLTIFGKSVMAVFWLFLLGLVHLLPLFLPAKFCWAQASAVFDRPITALRSGVFQTTSVL